MARGDRCLPRPAASSRTGQHTLADFQSGGSDKVNLKKIAAVENNAVAAAATSTTFAYVPGIVGSNVAIVDISTMALVSAVTSGTTNP